MPEISDETKELMRELIKVNTILIDILYKNILDGKEPEYPCGVVDYGWKRMALAGNKVAAIKEARSVHGYELAWAKKVVEAYLKDKVGTAYPTSEQLLEYTNKDGRV